LLEVTRAVNIMAVVSPKVLYGPVESLRNYGFEELCRKWEIKDSAQAMKFLEALSWLIQPAILTSFWQEKANNAGVDKYLLWIWTVASDFTGLPDAERALQHADDNLDNYYLLHVMRKYCCTEANKSMDELATECHNDFMLYQQVTYAVLASQMQARTASLATVDDMRERH
jgi:hypothetical protein